MKFISFTKDFSMCSFSGFNIKPSTTKYLSCNNFTPQTISLPIAESIDSTSTVISQAKYQECKSQVLVPIGNGRKVLNASE